MSEHDEKDLPKATLEPVQVIEAWDLSYHLGTALRKLHAASSGRAGARAESLRTAIYHLNRELAKLTSSGASS